MRWVIGIAVSAALALLVGTPQAGERWDMPTAYAESNYHAENARLFAEAVGVCTGGSLEISVHANESLLKGDEIMRAVESGKAPIGERLLSAHQEENPVFGFESSPRGTSCSSTRCPGRRRGCTSSGLSRASRT